ncbi:ATP-binding protein [Archangium sp.]|uniref:AAA family ATPase n=1 Tax=Archangium sp. TaxID=1872627 RepID=UPI002D543091|nr:ATP-binding protein [Archangium sp.]HYO55012.1 ATP-binding protein [Archangium sp.]
MLLKAGAEGDAESFRRAAEEVIRDERAKKHHLLANDLERILYGEAGRSKSARELRPLRELPCDERGLDLLVVRAPVRDLQDIVLSDEVRSALDEVLLEQSRSEILASHGLKPAGRLLFCGPPGCGKTSAAEVLATELGLELAIVRFDAVVSSFLGETAANLRKVFDFLARERVVALFDEFDAIGKEREDASEHGELKRVVNSFLQMLDGYRGRSLIVAATNHERMLDRALWRRFDDVLLFERPNTEQLRELLMAKLRGVRHELPVASREFLSRFRGFSHADVERVVIRAIKLMVLKGREFVTPDLLEEALRREEKRLSLVSKQTIAP